MQVGGGFSNPEARVAEPSAGGHGVSPVMAVPGIVLGGATVVAELSEGTVVYVVETEESRPIRRDSPKAAASAMTTMTRSGCTSCGRCCDAAGAPARPVEPGG